MTTLDIPPFSFFPPRQDTYIQVMLFVCALPLQSELFQGDFRNPLFPPDRARKRWIETGVDRVDNIVSIGRAG